MIVDNLPAFIRITICLTLTFRLQRIQSINSGNYTWRATVNQFTDLTDEELTASTRGLDRSMYFAEIPMRKSVQYVESTEGNGKIVTEQDWRKSGVITPVKNQGHCGEHIRYTIVPTVMTSTY